MEWFRFYIDTLDNIKIQSLPGSLYKIWANMMCLARIYDGELPNMATMVLRLRMNERSVSKALDELILRNLFDRMEDDTIVPHDWNHWQYKSDNSAERQRRSRMNRRRTPINDVTSLSRDTSQPQYVNGHTNVATQIQSRTDTETDTEHTHEYVELPRNGSVRGFKETSTPVARRFEEFIKPWPTVADMDGAMRAWLSRVKTTDLEEAFACRDRYLQSDQVKRGVWTEPKKFINQQADSGWRGKWARAATANGISDADKELIAQVERDVESGRKTREERMKQKW